MTGTVESAPRRKFRPSGRNRRALRLAVATPLVYLAWAGTIAEQDTTALIEATRGNAPRWMSAIEAAPHASSVAPSLVLADASGARNHDGPDYAVTNAAPGSDPAVIRGLETIVRDSKPDTLPEKTPVNRSAKGDRFVSLAPDRQMVDAAAGSVFAMNSLLGARDPAALPRVAFVRPEIPAGTATMIAQAKQRGVDLPLDLTQMAMARNVAATSMSLASAYAPERTEDLRAPFEALLGGAAIKEKLTMEARRGGDPFWWATAPLPANVTSAKEQRCLAEAIYFEARGEPVEGQVAVSQVVLNRVRNPAYPNTICKVVYQNRHLRNRCQFSFACDRIRDRINERPQWELAKRVAAETVSGERYLENVGASTHYHATYVSPRWARQMKRLDKIGQHIFYKTRRGGWS